MAITPRSFLRNPLLLVLMLIGGLAAGSALAGWSPCQSACPNGAKYKKATKVTKKVKRTKPRKIKQIKPVTKPPVVKEAPVKAPKGWLGVHIQTLDANLAKEVGARSDIKGVLIRDVLDDYPAQYAGFKKNDVVTHFNGKAVFTACQLKKAVGETEPGSRAQARVVRENKALVLQPILAKRPKTMCGCAADFKNVQKLQLPENKLPKQVKRPAPPTRGNKVVQPRRAVKPKQVRKPVRKLRVD